jgi:nitrogen fixation protein FixH
MRELKGWHVLAIWVGAFGVIIAVNLTLAWNAVATHPGREVHSSYAASQVFDRERRAQEALGWTLAEDYSGGVLSLAFTDARGRPAELAALSVLVGRPATDREDQRPVFTRNGNRFVSPVALGPGTWILRVEAEAADGTRFRKRLNLWVRSG